MSRTIHPTQCPQKTPSSCTQQGPRQTADTTFSPVLIFMASTASSPDSATLSRISRLQCVKGWTVGSLKKGSWLAPVTSHIITFVYSHDLRQIVQLYAILQIEWISFKTEFSVLHFVSLHTLSYWLQMRQHVNQCFPWEFAFFPCCAC